MKSQYYGKKLTANIAKHLTYYKNYMHVMADKDLNIPQ